MGVLEFDEDGEMILVAVHPGSSVEQIQANTGWQLKVAEPLRNTPLPLPEDIAMLRSLDSEGVHLRRGY
jgi:acyl CoA:acetate/3-ketoacid CoA transferase beta subunit